MASENVEHVLLPAENGELGILPGHVAMACSLQVGRIRVDTADEFIELATSGGFAEVLDDRIIIAAETAEKAGEIDLERADRARDRAQEKLRRRDDETIDDARAQGALRRALNRLRVAAEA